MQRHFGSKKTTYFVLGYSKVVLQSNFQFQLEGVRAQELAKR